MPRLPPPEPAPDAPAIDVNQVKVRLPQLRVLAALAGDDPDDPPMLTRTKVCQRAGFSEISGTITSALNGIREGSSSGPARPGLIELGLVEKRTLDIEGEPELVFYITSAGRAVLERQGAELVEFPELRDAASSTNRRYKAEAEE